MNYQKAWEELKDNLKESYSANRAQNHNDIASTEFAILERMKELEQQKDNEYTHLFVLTLSPEENEHFRDAMARDTDESRRISPVIPVSRVGVLLKTMALDRYKVDSHLYEYVSKIPSNDFRIVIQESGIKTVEVPSKWLEGMEVTQHEKSNSYMSMDTPYGNLPAGEEWHNPDNLTPEQVGVADGWRLLLKSEIGRIKLEGVECLATRVGGMSWKEAIGKWFGSTSGLTYRTKLPIGELSKQSIKDKLKEKCEDCDFNQERTCAGALHKDGFGAEICKFKEVGGKNQSVTKCNQLPNKSEYIEDDLIEEIKVKDQKIVELSAEINTKSTLIEDLWSQIKENGKKMQEMMKLYDDLNKENEGLHEVRRGDQDLIRGYEAEIDDKDRVIELLKHDLETSNKEVANLKEENGGLLRVQKLDKTALAAQQADCLHFQRAYKNAKAELKSRIAMWDELKDKVTKLFNTEHEKAKPCFHEVLTIMTGIESRHTPMGDMEHDLKETLPIEPTEDSKRIEFVKQVSQVINCLSLEGICNVPDYKLAEYLWDCLNKHPKYPTKQHIDDIAKAMEEGSDFTKHDISCTPTLKRYDMNYRHGCEVPESYHKENILKKKQEKHTSCEGYDSNKNCPDRNTERAKMVNYSCWTVPKEPKSCKGCFYYQGEGECSFKGKTYEDFSCWRKEKEPTYGPQPSVKAKQDELANALQERFGGKKECNHNHRTLGANGVARCDCGEYPKYRPYKDASEVPFPMRVRCKESMGNSYLVVHSVGEEGITYTFGTVSSVFIPYENLFKEWEQYNGEPCGVKL